MTIEIYCIKNEKVKCVVIDQYSKSKDIYIDIIKITLKYYLKINPEFYGFCKSINGKNFFFLITDFEEQKNYKVITEFEG